MFSRRRRTHSSRGSDEIKSKAGYCADGISVDAFFSYQNPAKLGIRVNTQLSPGLRSDKLLEKIIPGEAPTASSDTVAVTLDTHDGLTFGSGKDKKIVVPIRFSFPGLELREFSVAEPQDQNKGSGRIDLALTIAGKIGDVVGIVAEGGGVTITWTGGPFQVRPKPPDAAGLKVDASVVKGGGYLRYQEQASQYGGYWTCASPRSASLRSGCSLLTPSPSSW